MSEYAILKDGIVVTVDVLEWAAFFEESDNRRVAKTILDHCEVSTVFLGLNHAFGNSSPLWFETMVFGGPLDQEVVRYGTLEEARRGHDRMVARVKDTAPGSGGEED